MIENITLKGCMEFAVAIEESGAKFYSQLATKFSSNENISQVFSQLAEDEKVHKAQFTELLKKAPTEEGARISAEKDEYLKAMSISDFFSHHQDPFKDLESIKNRNDALQKAFEFEKATLGFYKAIEDVLGKNPLLTQIINMEKGHISVLMKALLVEGSKFRSLQEKWP